MSVYNFFSRLRQQVSFNQSNSNDEQSSNATASQNEDTEDDGYLLIGETKNVSSSQFGTEETPNYGLLPSELLSYRNDLHGEITNASGPTMFSRINILPLKSEDFTFAQNQRSPLSDIPFKLHPVLDAQRQANAIFHDLDLEPCNFDWSKYSHDFMKENLSLRDMNSDEMANIDEFMLPQIDSLHCTKLPSRNSEVCLMQF